MRTADEIGVAGPPEFPPPGWYKCQCVDAELGQSRSGTEYVKLTFDPEGEIRFSESFYCTEKTLKRLNLVAQRLCGMLPDTELPDDDMDAARFMMQFIYDNAVERWAEVQIEEKEEKYTIKTGKNAGKEATQQKRQIAFAGFETMEQPEDADELPERPPAMPPQNKMQAPPPNDPYPNVPDPFADPEPAEMSTEDDLPF